MKECLNKACIQDHKIYSKLRNIPIVEVSKKVRSMGMDVWSKNNVSTGDQKI